ncbi:hypothetical protein PENSPDRAFT_734141 [Peniophora sp. CONT]|nr:hypothetical protein PENSPDRAFT_734141 [Peniophora sp. CONT]
MSNTPLVTCCPAPTYTDFDLAARYLRFLLFDSILTCIYGLDVAVDRALRVLRHAWNDIPPGERPSFYDFTTTHTPVRSRLREYHQYRVVAPGAIPLFLPSCAFDAPFYRATGLNAYESGYCAMDVTAVNSDYAKFIPSTLFIPYKTRSSARCRQILERINPIPLWFFGEDGVLGFPVQGNTNSIKLLHGQEALRLKSNDKPISTLKIKFAWPNYQPDEKQIRATPNSPLNNLNTLASRTAGAVRTYMSDETKKVMVNENLVPQPWKIGTQPGEVRIADVLLLGVIFVSEGAAMPLLSVY